MNWKLRYQSLFVFLLFFLSIHPIQAYVAPDMVLYSNAVLLYDKTTSTIIYESNADQVMYPASLTKILTALVVLEQETNLSNSVTITESMLAGLKSANASVAGYVSGEILTIEQLLYGLLLPSGADAANALSIHIAGSVEQFVSLMNATAMRIGMTHSHFVNPTGLDHANQITTATDMLVLLDYALSFDLFRAVISTNEYEFMTNKHPNGIKLLSSMLIGKDEASQYYSPFIMGGKTGYTGKAGRCLASFATLGDMELLLITLNAPFEGFAVPSKSFFDAQAIYAWAFDRFYHTTFAAVGETIETITIKQSWSSSMEVVWPTDVRLLLDRYSSEEPVLQVSLDEVYQAPLMEGDELGSAQLIYEGKTIFETPLVSHTLVKHSKMVQVFQAIGHFMYRFRLFFYAILACLGSLLLLRYLNIRRYHKKRRQMEKRRKQVLSRARK